MHSCISRRHFIKSMCAASLIEVVNLSDAKIYTVKPSFMLLKLDDFVANKSGDISDKWKKTIHFLNDNQVNASFGVLGNYINNKNDHFLKVLIDLTNSNQFEIWNHGYAKNSLSSTFIDNVETQFNYLNEIQKKLFLTTGKAPNFFGPHSSNFNEHTFLALSKIDSIKGVWFYKPPQHLKNRFIFIPRTIEAEKPIFNRNIDTVFSGYEYHSIKRTSISSKPMG